MNPESRDGHNVSSNAAGHGEYVVVARRYRPQSFGQLIGQDLVSQALKNAILTDRVGHAYLFTGARGVGKTSTARILAKALNCVTGPTTEPCGQCDICQRVASGEDVDVLEIDGASNRGIDEIRQLRSNVGIRPSRSRFKIYIIDEVHMLTKEAFNALLKTLEEPPPHVKFIFCTTEAGKIPITVLSRCQQFDFSPVDASEIANRLAFIVEQEGATAQPAALELLARRAAGSMRDSQSLLEQLLAFVGTNITVDHVHAMFGTAKADRVYAIVDRLIDRNAAGVLTELQSTLDQGVDPGQLGEQLVTSLRDIMAMCVGCDPNLLLFHSPSDAKRLVDYGSRWGIDTLLAATQILDQAVTRMRQSVHARILLEVALIRVARLEDLDQLSAVIPRIAAGQADQPTSGTEGKKKEIVRVDRIDPPAAPVLQGPHSTAQSPMVAAGIGAMPPVTPATAGMPTTGELATAVLPLTEMKDVLTVKESSAAPAPVTVARVFKSLDSENLSVIWQEALASLGDVTAEFAAKAIGIAISGPNRLAIRFVGRYNSSKSYCERPEPREKLEKAVSEIVGERVRLEFVEEPHESAPAPTRTAVNPQQLRRAISSHPMVACAMDLFQAEIAKVESSGN
jgi:DNA polymerase-3 subunit gamma/tau